MSSKLYADALARLDASEAPAVEDFERRLADCHRAIDGGDGVRLVSNIRNETRLCGDSACDDPAEMSEFLQACAYSTATGTALWVEYSSICTRFAARGHKILRSCLPDELLRYSISRALVVSIVERVLGITARLRLQRGQLSIDDAFEQLRLFWSKEDVKNEMLGFRSHVFATFDDGSDLDRQDGGAVASALALPIMLRTDRSDVFLYEFSYPTNAVSDYRFPTVADAGQMHVFAPCIDVVPHSTHPDGCVGRTVPLGSFPAQPELLHLTANLAVLARPPRLLGDIDG